MIFGLIFVTAALGMKVFDLDVVDVVEIQPGEVVEVEGEAEIMRAITWVIDDTELIRFQIDVLKPRAKEGQMIGASRSVHKITCTRDCKVGEVFTVYRKYTDVRQDKLLETRQFTVKVVPAKVEL